MTSVTAPLLSLENGLRTCSSVHELSVMMSFFTCCVHSCVLFIRGNDWMAWCGQRVNEQLLNIDKYLIFIWQNVYIYRVIIQYNYLFDDLC